MISNPRSTCTRRLGRWLALAVFGIAHWSAWGAAPLSILVYPAAEGKKDARSEYPVALLELIIAQSGGGVTLQRSSLPMQQLRVLKSLSPELGQVNVAWTSTSPEREKIALPIRFPIDKGLFGWRIALVRAEKYDLFSKVTSLAELRSFTAGQGHDWPDLQVLREAGLPVEEAANYDSLFAMLSARRFDYLPRSVVEVWPEIDQRRDQGLIVDSGLLFHYPSALYFFVSKSNRALAEYLEAGLNRALLNGSFDALFYRFFGAQLERARIANRKVIELPNTQLPPETPLQRKELWFVPDIARMEK